MRDWFDNLPQRDQLSLLVLAAAVTVWLIYTMLWSPLAVQRDNLRQRNAAQVQRLERVDALVSEVAVLRERGDSSADRRNLAALVNQTTRRNDLRVTRLQPNSRGEIQVRFENVPVDSLLRWMHNIEYNEGLVIPDAAINLAGAAGRVNAAVRIAGGA